MKYKFKEQDNIINVIEGDNIIARYTIDKHWEQKNMSIKDDDLELLRSMFDKEQDKSLSDTIKRLVDSYKNIIDC